MPLICKICIVEKKGITIKDSFNSQEELNNHLESEHHLPIIREGETEEEAIARFLKKYPEAARCPDCIEKQAKWVQAKWVIN